MNRKHSRAPLRAAVGYIIALFFLSTTSFAQDGDRPTSRWFYGAYLGLNLATISNSETGFGPATVAAGKTTNRSGFKLGEYFNFPLTGKLSFQPEGIYAQNGVMVQTTDGSNGKVSVQLNYFELPMLLRYDFAVAHKFHPMLIGGASGAYRQRCSLKTSIQGQVVQEQCNKLLDRSADPFKKFDASLVSGGAIETVFQGRPISLQVRYTYGLVGIATSIADGSNVRNRALSFMVGFGNR
ncbi:MAG: porin family protein [Gemmatimonadaceae bacterium]